MVNESKKQTNARKLTHAWADARAPRKVGDELGYDRPAVHRGWGAHTREAEDGWHEVDVRPEGNDRRVAPHLCARAAGEL